MAWLFAAELLTILGNPEKGYRLLIISFLRRVKVFSWVFDMSEWVSE
jgi:hypothetical protein